MELEFLKKLVDRYGSTSVADIAKTISEPDINNPMVLFGFVLIALSLAAFAAYVLVSVFSPRSSKGSLEVTESSIYHLNSRISSLELAVSEYKNTIKHLNQQISANKLSITNELNGLRADLRNSIIEDLRILDIRKAA